VRKKHYAIKGIIFAINGEQADKKEPWPLDPKGGRDLGETLETPDETKKG